MCSRWPRPHRTAAQAGPPSDASLSLTDLWSQLPADVAGAYVWAAPGHTHTHTPAFKLAGRATPYTPPPRRVVLQPDSWGGRSAAESQPVSAALAHDDAVEDTLALGPAHCATPEDDGCGRGGALLPAQPSPEPARQAPCWR